MFRFIFTVLLVGLIIRNPASAATFLIDDVSRSYSVAASDNNSSVRDSLEELVLGATRSKSVEKQVGGVTVRADAKQALDVQASDKTYTIVAETSTNAWARLDIDPSACSGCVGDADAFVNLVGSFDFSSVTVPTALLFFDKQHNPLGDTNTGTLTLSNANNEILFQQPLEELAASFAVPILSLAPIHLGFTMRSESTQTPQDGEELVTDTDSQAFALSFTETNADLDGDGLLGVGDIDLLTQKFNAGSSDAAFDINLDGLVDQEDRRMWVEEIAGTHFGDANLDGEVNFSDFLTFAINFGKHGGWADGNFDGVRGVEFLDFLTLDHFFGRSGSPTTTAVPEPDTFLLALLGLTYLGLRRHRRSETRT